MLTFAASGTVIWEQHQVKVVLGWYPPLLNTFTQQTFVLLLCTMHSAGTENSTMKDSVHP